ncbi:MAG TPA: VOC family protein [Rhodanobacteraceae bacterium]|nr:VOC family protein [Rhodanobacteraceae bacterium]
MASANPVVWFEIYVDDMARATAFYERVLNVKLSRLDSPGRDMMQFGSDMDAYGASGALIRVQDVKPGGMGTMVYFASDDCIADVDRVVPAGGRVQRKKQSIGENGYIALAVDTEGNMFGFHSMK